MKEREENLLDMFQTFFQDAIAAGYIDESEVFGGIEFNPEWLMNDKVDQSFSRIIIEAMQAKLAKCSTQHRKINSNHTADSKVGKLKFRRLQEDYSLECTVIGEDPSLRFTITNKKDPEKDPDSRLTPEEFAKASRAEVIRMRDDINAAL